LSSSKPLPKPSTAVAVPSSTPSMGRWTISCCPQSCSASESINQRNGTTTVDDDIDPPSHPAPWLTPAATTPACRVGRRRRSVYIGPDIDIRKVAPWGRDVFAKIEIELSVRGGKLAIATLDPTDTDGFVSALGNWVSNARFRR
jgi:hypothetical protein